MVPLAEACRSQGHHVGFASMDGGEVVANSGFEYVSLAPGVDWRSEIRALGKNERPELFKRVAESNASDREAFAGLAGRVNNLVAGAVVDAVARWRPDVIIYEYLFPAALVAAAVLSVPAVQHDLNFVRTPALRAIMLREMIESLDRYGIARPTPVTTLDIAPPSMVKETYGWNMRPVPYNGQAALPDLLAVPTERPRVAVTLGTVLPYQGGPTNIDRIVEAAAEVDAEFVLALGERGVRALSNTPPNVRIFGWLPWRQLLNRSQAAIHHGGSSSALCTLDAGIPQIVLPAGSDCFITAHAVHERGAGLDGTVHPISPSLIKRVLSDTKMATAARRVRTEIEAMPTPGDIASRLAGLAG
ncbi:glycosyltransferase [Streptomyces sp. NPDC051133]|uniref:glycosyltransferase n=1 Tax=Streptomyces sp. NPDC051133 TaxID=3155521 RepID=UPI00344AB4DC